MAPHNAVLDDEDPDSAGDLIGKCPADDGGRLHERLPGPYTLSNSLAIDRLIERSPISRPWAMVIIGLVLLLLPTFFALVDGIGVAQLFADYRAQFMYAFLIVYLLAASHLVQSTREGVARSLRPIIRLDEPAFIDLVKQGCRISPGGEFVAFGAGLIVGLIVNIVFEPISPGPYFMTRYAYLSRILVYGVFGWSIHVVISMTGLTNLLLRQPIDVDIFNLRPFEPIGRQSLWLSLALVVGMLLALATSNFSAQELRLLYLIVNAIMITIIVAVFLLDTHSVHWLLASAKRDRLATVEQHLARDTRRLEELLANNEDTLAIATEMSALSIAKQEIRSTRTWPYNTEMIRTIAISVITPLAVAISRLAAAFLAGPP